ncbi:MAG TPA: TetR/AcrR family transcriptional regulator [Candidatus Dormibacteraeota bacterium]|jgi:AcrR family transcriptional regulator
MGDLPLTPRGRASRDRILAVAAGLMARNGVAATSIEEVLAAAGAGKSQLYHYFGDRLGLVDAVIRFQVGSVLETHRRELAGIADWDGIRRWFDLIVTIQEGRRCAGGCPLGTLGAELADTDMEARRIIDAGFGSWEGAIGDTIERLAGAGLIAAGADVGALRIATLSAIQGGLLLSKTARSVAPLRIALDMALEHLRRAAPPPAPVTAHG